MCQPKPWRLPGITNAFSTDWTRQHFQSKGSVWWVIGNWSWDAFTGQKCCSRKAEVLFKSSRTHHTSSGVQLSVRYAAEVAATASVVFCAVSDGPEGVQQNLQRIKGWADHQLFSVKATRQKKVSYTSEGHGWRVVHIYKRPRSRVSMWGGETTFWEEQQRIGGELVKYYRCTLQMKPIRNKYIHVMEREGLEPAFD